MRPASRCNPGPAFARPTRMLKKFTAPYRFAPAIISTKRIDAALTQGAQAEIQSPGRGGYKAVSLVTFRLPDGRVIDQYTLQGNVRMGHKFVVAYNRKLASMR